MSIKAAIQALAGTNLADEIHMAVATVKAVNLDEYTCTVELTSGNAAVYRSNVRLMAAVDDGMLLVPAIDSPVIIAWSTRNQPYVALFSQLQDVYLSADGVVTLQGSDFGGLVKVGELVQKLNNLENKVNNIISSYNAHVHTDPQGGTVGPASNQVSGTLTPTVNADIENTKVVHGI